MSPYDIELIQNYRIEFIEEMLENKMIGTIKENANIRTQERQRLKYLQAGLNQTTISNPNGIKDYDIRKIWTAVYPRIYTDHKPMFVDWENERVFKEEIIVNFQKNLTKIYYKIVPKEPEILPEILTLLLWGKNSKEVFFERRK